MLPEETRNALAEKVRLHFENDDYRLTSAALRMQDDGYDDDVIIHILNLAYWAGYTDGCDDGSRWAK